MIQRLELGSAGQATVVLTFELGFLSARCMEGSVLDFNRGLQ